MERLLFVRLFFCLGHTFVCAQTEPNYFVIGKSLELRPPPDQTNINSIAWRHKGNFVAEYAKDAITLEIYGAFKGRTDLNITTGYLQISKTIANDAGEFSLEINNIKLNVQYIAKAIEEVPKPYIWVTPDGDDRKLTCDGNVEKAEPVSYFWNMGGEKKNWTKGEKRLVFQKNKKTHLVETISCKMVNPVSEKESEPIKNPFDNNGPDSSGNVAGWVVGVLFLVVVGVLVGLGIWKKEWVKALWARLRARLCSDGNEPVTPDNNDVSTPLDTAAKPT